MDKVAAEVKVKTFLSAYYVPHTAYRKYYEILNIIVLPKSHDFVILADILKTLPALICYASLLKMIYKNILVAFHIHRFYNKRVIIGNGRCLII
jgi:hypothetical protein